MLLSAGQNEGGAAGSSTGTDAASDAAAAVAEKAGVQIDTVGVGTTLEIRLPLAGPRVARPT